MAINTGIKPIGDSVICGMETTTDYTVTNIPGEMLPQWQIFPPEAGAVSSNGNIATINWNTQYEGNAMIRVICDIISSN